MASHGDKVCRTSALHGIISRAKFARRAAQFTIDHIPAGEPATVEPRKKVDRFVSTYCLDLLSEDDMDGVLTLAQRSLEPRGGLLLLAGITWGCERAVSSNRPSVDVRQPSARLQWPLLARPQIVTRSVPSS